MRLELEERFRRELPHLIEEDVHALAGIAGGKAALCRLTRREWLRLANGRPRNPEGRGIVAPRPSEWE